MMSAFRGLISGPTFEHIVAPFKAQKHHRVVYNQAKPFWYGVHSQLSMCG